MQHVGEVRPMPYVAGYGFSWKALNARPKQSFEDLCVFENPFWLFRAPPASYLWLTCPHLFCNDERIRSVRLEQHG
jgi:hypothetical protein